MLYIIITASIHDKTRLHKNDEYRKRRYVESISHLLENIKDVSVHEHIKVIVVENNGQRNTYLDEFRNDFCEILYTNNNQIAFPHKGGNELMDIKTAIHHYNIQHEDMIIKITGRYKLLDLQFIDFVKNNNCDAYVKFFNVCTLQYLPDDCVLGMFATKCKLLKNFEYKYIKSPECEFAEYIKQNSTNLAEIQTLNLECCFADDLRILNV